MVETYYLVVLLASLISLVSWRTGLYLAILLDVVRDPVRKISDDQSVFITVAAAVVWGAAFLGMFLSDAASVRQALSRFPSLHKGIIWLVLAVIPGAAISVLSYAGGYKLAIIGAISYLAPLLGIAIGFAFPKTEKDMRRLLIFYSIINSIFLVGTVLEWQNVNVPGLGGIEMDWVRNYGELHIKLIAGFYRSPDIMGLHAAHVIVFCALLTMQSRGLGRVGWSSLAVWAAFCVLLSGRRKMIGIPLVFIGSFLLIGLARGSRVTSRLMTVVALGALIGAVALFSIQEEGSSNEYQQFASTLVTQAASRIEDAFGGEIYWTIQQSGVLGSGLGSATQGSHYVKVKGGKAWQEDGISRCFKELGLPGVLCLVIAMIFFIKTVMISLKLVPPNHPLQTFQIGLLAVVLGDLASFIVSHQQFSGDPVSAIIVLMLLGMVLSFPRIYAMKMRQRSQVTPPLSKPALSPMREPEVAGLPE